MTSKSKSRRDGVSLNIKKNSEERKCCRRRFCGGKKVYGTAKMDRTRKSITTAVSSQNY
jgi:hypothetical protein